MLSKESFWQEKHTLVGIPHIIEDNFPITGINLNQKVKYHITLYNYMQDAYTSAKALIIFTKINYYEGIGSGIININLSEAYDNHNDIIPIIPRMLLGNKESKPNYISINIGNKDEYKLEYNIIAKNAQSLMNTINKNDVLAVLSTFLFRIHTGNDLITITNTIGESLLQYDCDIRMDGMWDLYAYLVNKNKI
jgi:hypothetical protein